MKKHSEIAICEAQTREDARAKAAGRSPYCIQTMADIVYAEGGEREVGLGEEFRAGTTDGATRLATMEDIKPGVILRAFDSEGRTYPFGDVVVTKTYASPDGSPVFDVVRPYAFEHFGGHLMNAEQVGHIGESTLKSGHYRVVLTSRGKPYTCSIGS